MSNTTTALSLRVPADAFESLSTFAESEGITVADAALQAIYSFVADKVTTAPAAKRRMAAEATLTAEVMNHAATIRGSDFASDVTREMFKWISNNHRGTYDCAIGSDGQHAIRINPQLARRFAYAIGAKPVLNAKRNPVKGYLPRNANELIQSYTLLTKASP